MKLISLLVCLLFCINSFSQKTPNQIKVVPFNYESLKGKTGFFEDDLTNSYIRNGDAKFNLKDFIGAIAEYAKAIQSNEKVNKGIPGKTGFESLSKNLDLQLRRIYYHRGRAKFLINDL
jgi:hypothetical protein